MLIPFIMSPSQQQPSLRFTILYCSLSSLLLLCSLQTCASLDSISANQTFIDGETIVSAGERFEMGFFSPRNSSNRYVGIWYHKISPQTIVWVANRETPITNTSGGGRVLRLNPGGMLELLNATNTVIWSSNSSGSVSNPVAQLLDNANFIIRDESDSNPNNFFWQSFDFPGNTLLPGMRIGKNLVTGRQWLFTSWKTADDPSPGEFTTFIDTSGYPQMLLMRGTELVLRSGPWNGIRFVGDPNMRPNPYNTYEFVLNQNDVYYHEEQTNSVIARVEVRPGGDVQRVLWIESSQQWTVLGSRQTDSCDGYGFCGVYGSCNIDNFPACGCLEGFEPRFPQQWNVANWSGGCQRRTPLDCGPEEGFLKYSEKKLPDTRHSWYNLTMNLDECQQLCKNNCSCTAYANTDMRGSGSGCVLWLDELLDIRDFPNIGQDIYIRMAASELIFVKSEGKESKALQQVKIIIPIILPLLIVLGSFLLYVFKRRKVKGEGNRSKYSAVKKRKRRVFRTRKLKVEGILGRDVRPNYNKESRNENLELPLFTLSTLLTATNNFSVNQKLGEGAFGPVYKGELLTGQEIAVKRLSKNSWQGLQEFKNEIRLISKLQHRNLVKVLGCCLEEEERMIAYEYMPNKSLDYFIFDKEKRMLLTWQHRMAIGIGIAKGLLYLHDDSRVRIIHRDLKASNILLDRELIPKISDFGIARIFGGDQGEGRTTRVVGTYGYMSPEYAIHGKFSVKSDVYSFGVLLIEIMSGKKNTKYQHPDHHHSLLGHTWLLWKEGKALELLDANLEDSCLESQVLRFIQVGLLCIQKCPEDRPTMSSVVFMLSNEGAMVIQPKEPGFYLENVSFGKQNSLSENAVTITKMEGR